MRELDQAPVAGPGRPNLAATAASTGQQSPEHNDPVGNVVHVHDDGISPSFFDNQQQQTDWDHTYDP